MCRDFRPSRGDEKPITYPPLQLPVLVSWWLLFWLRPSLGSECPAASLRSVRGSGSLTAMPKIGPGGRKPRGVPVATAAKPKAIASSAACCLFRATCPQSRDSLLHHNFRAKRQASNFQSPGNDEILFVVIPYCDRSHQSTIKGITAGQMILFLFNMGWYYTVKK